MNQRIRELAEQSGWIFADRATGKFSDYDLRLEKFSQALISECIVALAPKLESEFDVFVTNGMIDRVKQHFGVEQ